MKILGIMGSPRIKGNTDLLLDKALQGGVVSSEDEPGTPGSRDMDADN